MLKKNPHTFSLTGSKIGTHFPYGPEQSHNSLATPGDHYLKSGTYRGTKGIEWSKSIMESEGVTVRESKGERESQVIKELRVRG